MQSNDEIDCEGEEADMERRQVIFKVVLELDEKWAAQLTKEELLEYIRERLNSSLGFRGQVKRFRVVSR
jgi:hypothetical protein